MELPLAWQRPRAGDPASDPSFELALGPQPLSVNPKPSLHNAAAHLEWACGWLAEQHVGFGRVDTQQQPAPATRAHRHVAVDQEGQAAKHALFSDALLGQDELSDPIGEVLVICHLRIIRLDSLAGAGGASRSQSGPGVGADAVAT
jgi:hypothetical protein